MLAIQCLQRHVTTTICDACRWSWSLSIQLSLLLFHLVLLPFSSSFSSCSKFSALAVSHARTCASYSGAQSAASAVSSIDVFNSRAQQLVTFQCGNDHMVMFPEDALGLHFFQTSSSFVSSTISRNVVSGLLVLRACVVEKCLVHMC